MFFSIILQSNHTGGRKGTGIGIREQDKFEKTIIYRGLFFGTTLLAEKLADFSFFFSFLLHSLEVLHYYGVPVKTCVSILFRFLSSMYGYTTGE